LEDVPPHFLREVEHFFSTYKQLEGVTTEPLGWGPVSEGMEEVFLSVDRYRAATEGLHR
jgi:inorganic pyrophosphatase